MKLNSNDRDYILSLSDDEAQELALSLIEMVYRRKRMAEINPGVLAIGDLLPRMELKNDSEGYGGSLSMLISKT